MQRHRPKPKQRGRIIPVPKNTRPLPEPLTNKSKSTILSSDEKPKTTRRPEREDEGLSRVTKENIAKSSKKTKRKKTSKSRTRRPAPSNSTEHRTA